MYSFADQIEKHMLVDQFRENCALYQNFAIWDIENMAAFFDGNSTLVEIFQKDFKIPIGEYNARRAEIAKTDMEIMRQLLDQIGDKHFYIFTYHDDNHWELTQMQTNGIMDFGIDIENIEKDHVYIMLMDRKSDVNSTLN